MSRYGKSCGHSMAAGTAGGAGRGGCCRFLAVRGKPLRTGTWRAGTLLHGPPGRDISPDPQARSGLAAFPKRRAWASQSLARSQDGPLAKEAPRAAGRLGALPSPGQQPPRGQDEALDPHHGVQAGATACARGGAAGLPASAPAVQGSPAWKAAGRDVGRGFRPAGDQAGHRGKGVAAKALGNRPAAARSLLLQMPASTPRPEGRLAGRDGRRARPHWQKRARFGPHFHGEMTHLGRRRPPFLSGPRTRARPSRNRLLPTPEPDIDEGKVAGAPRRTIAIGPQEVNVLQLDDDHMRRPPMGAGTTGRATVGTGDGRGLRRGWGSGRRGPIPLRRHRGRD